MEASVSSDPQSLDPFMNLPNEMIVQICENMSNSDLLNMSEASSKVYQVCSEIREKREIAEYRKRLEREKLMLRVTRDVGYKPRLKKNYISKPGIPRSIYYTEYL